MRIDLPFEITFEQLEKAIRKVASNHWWIKKDVEEEHKYVMSDGIETTKKEEQGFILRLKWFPLSEIHISYFSWGSSFWIYGIFFPSSWIAKKICKELESEVNKG